MGAYNVVSSSALAAGQPEDISVVLANFNAIAAVINGGLDNSNLAAAAGIAASKISGYPSDGTKAFFGDGTWKVPALTPLPTIATTLPGSPTDQQQAILTDNVTTPTYAWLFEWSTAAAKWFFCGGSPAYAEVIASESTASGTYIALTTAGPSFTVPRAGDYLVEQGCSIAAGGASIQGYMSYDIGGTGAVDADGFAQGMGGGGTQGGNFVGSRARRKTGLAASTALVSKYRSATGTVPFNNRWMRVTPIVVT